MFLLRLPAFAVLAAGIVLAACGGTGAEDCRYLFGAPGEATGLDASICRPERICEETDDFVPPEYGAAEIEALRSRVLVDPPALLPASPYEDPSLVPAHAVGYCAVFADGREPGGYVLETVGDAAEAAARGGVVTHAGACGACSSLQDLAVYLSMPDLGGPVRQCALLQLTRDEEATLECIEDLGFSPPCAQIWAFNSANTRGACLEDCLTALADGTPNNLPDGSLNPCLACDEEQSGPVFKAVAGRTRRNSGIPSAVCRPGDTVDAVWHDVYP